mmetsp:Transcript_82227/g.151175  ORF Transcript_82227/g.151175 Transcript_82227/m.151175 type:complete len:82 (+) Transcript_82227:3-248(+)
MPHKLTHIRQHHQICALRALSPSGPKQTSFSQISCKTTLSAASLPMYLTSMLAGTLMLPHKSLDPTVSVSENMATRAWKIT